MARARSHSHAHTPPHAQPHSYPLAQTQRPMHCLYAITFAPRAQDHSVDEKVVSFTSMELCAMTGLANAAAAAAAVSDGSASSMCATGSGTHNHRAPWPGGPCVEGRTVRSVHGSLPSPPLRTLRVMPSDQVLRYMFSSTYLLAGVCTSTPGSRRSALARTG